MTKRDEAIARRMQRLRAEGRRRLGLSGSEDGN